MLCIRVRTGEIYRWEYLRADNLLDADPTVGLTSGYGGRAFNAEWEQDIDVGIVFACNKVPPHLYRHLLPVKASDLAIILPGFFP